MDKEHLELIESCFNDMHKIIVPEDLDGPEMAITFRNKLVGKLKVTSGGIGACDAFELDAGSQFNFQFPVGEFPVELSLMSSEDGNEGVAFARVLFSAATPMTAETATFFDDGEETRSYGVDSGSACFYDIEAVRQFEDWMQDKEEWSEEIENNMAKVYEHTRSWYMLELGVNNVAIFTSGMGDGSYKSYLLYDSDGQIVQLVTDFDFLAINLDD